jgi:hypothetical protein
MATSLTQQALAQHSIVSTFSNSTITAPVLRRFVDEVASLAKLDALQALAAQACTVGKLRMPILKRNDASSAR